MMSVLLVLTTVSRYVLTELVAGIVAVMLATVYALMAEHVKVSIILLSSYHEKS